jgi:hypothetical protein
MRVDYPTRQNISGMHEEDKGSSQGALLLCCAEPAEIGQGKRKQWSVQCLVNK